MKATGVRAATLPALCRNPLLENPVRRSRNDVRNGNTRKAGSYLFIFFAFISSVSFGQTINNFTLPNAVDEKQISLSEYASAQGVVIIFTSNTCPYDGYYLSRMKDFTTQYAGKIPIVFINSGIEATESMDKMKAFANQNGLTVPYLADKDQKVMNMLNPRKSPEGFVLQRVNGQFKVVYRGAIDDNAQSASEVKSNYLQDAIVKLLAGQDIETSDVRPVGCSIRKK